MSILVIAEKPSVANTVATVLGANKKGVNYLYNDRYIVSWCLGHLVKLDDPVAYGDRFAEKPWKFENLPIIPEKWKFSVGGSTKSQYYVLKSLIERDDVNEIVCATDAGREGECIFRYMYYKTGCTKPVKRLWVSSLEEKAIKKAFQNQIDGKGFSLVEVISSCPTNWGLTPQKALEWIDEKMIPYYPLGVYRDKEG